MTENVHSSQSLFTFPYNQLAKVANILRFHPVKVRIPIFIIGMFLDRWPGETRSLFGITSCILWKPGVAVALVYFVCFSMCICVYVSTAARTLARGSMRGNMNK